MQLKKSKHFKKSVQYFSECLTHTVCLKAQRFGCKQCEAARFCWKPSFTNNHQEHGEIKVIAFPERRDVVTARHSINVGVCTFSRLKSRLKKLRKLSNNCAEFQRI